MSIESGQLKILGNDIIYNSQSYGQWTLPLSDVKAIGEYTSDQGPGVDDWFIIFFLKDGSWYEASYYCENISAFKLEIKNKLNIDEVCSDLGGSTDYDSYLIWPKALKGEKAFIFETFYPSWWRKLFFWPSIKFNLSKELDNYLKST